MGKPSTLIKSSLSAMSDRLVWNCSRHAACRRNESLLRRLKERIRLTEHVWFPALDGATLSAWILQKLD
jgi:dipeptidyl aminopeptidase/acylaminoacyl peptidase